MEIIQKIYQIYSRNYTFPLAKKASQVFKNIPVMPITTSFQKDIQGLPNDDFTYSEFARVMFLFLDLLIGICIPLIILLAGILDILLVTVVLIAGPIVLVIVFVIICTLATMLQFKKYLIINMER